MSDGPADHYSIRFYSKDTETHRKVFRAISDTGVECWEAGPGSVHDSDIRNAQRWADAEQFAAVTAEVARLRAAIVKAIASGSVEGLVSALGVGGLPIWDWRAAA